VSWRKVLQSLKKLTTSHATTSVTSVSPTTGTMKEESGRVGLARGISAAA